MNNDRIVYNFSLLDLSYHNLFTNIQKQNSKQKLD